MTQEQRYTVVQKIESYELRNYEACVVAEVNVDSDFVGAGNAGFRPLFNYIAGANAATQKVAMTSPVLHNPDIDAIQPEQLLHSGTHSKHTISFVMPAEFTEISELPSPSNSEVSLRAIPQELVLIDQFSGRWSESIYADRLAKLQLCASHNGYSVSGTPRFARFNPPWTPWFMRRNEIQLPVVTVGN